VGRDRRREIAVVTARAVIAIVALLAAPLHADSARDSDEVVAKQHFTRGKQLAASRDFAHAYDEFAAGYVVSHRAQFLFNMAECMRVLGDAARARDLYSQYLAANPDGELATAARTHVTELGGVAPEPQQPPAAPSIPAPAQAAEQHVAVTEPAPIAIARDEPSHPILHSVPFWVGVGVVIVGGAVGAYVLFHHHDSCSPPACVDLQ
jgi:hypothetical protein